MAAEMSCNSADLLSPYYLHHSDNPGLVLVSQTLTGDNFTSWYRAMVIALSVKNKLGFVDGSIPKPVNFDPNLLNSWIRNNNIVISWILNSVSKEISASIIFAESVSEIWEDLKDRFQQSNGPRLFQLRSELINHRQGQSSVSVYFTKLKTIWEELNNFRPQCVCCHCCEGVKKLELHHQLDYVLAFLLGLNESFAQVRSQILLLDPLPSINKVFSMTVQEERQRQIGSLDTSMHPPAGMVFTVKNEPRKFSPEVARGEYHKASHNKPRFNPKNYPRERPYCTICTIHGHTVDTCYKLHGYPPSYKTKACSESQNQSATVNQVSDRTPPAEHYNNTLKSLMEISSRA